MIQAAAAVGLVLLVGLVAAIIWLSRARKGQVQAEAKSDALEQGKRRKRYADQIMAEPVAFEPAWVRRARERVQERRRKS